VLTTNRESPNSASPFALRTAQPLCDRASAIDTRAAHAVAGLARAFGPLGLRRFGSELLDRWVVIIVRVNVRRTCAQRPLRAIRPAQC
jgi:hypothetical protein